MRSSDGRQNRNPVRSDIVQILGGLLLAVCLFQADRGAIGGPRGCILQHGLGPADAGVQRAYGPP